MKKIFILSVLFTVYSLQANAQSSITGKIVDVDNEPVDLASVSLLEQEELKIIKAEYTDSDGSFIINKVKPGKYSLRVSYIGYVDAIQQIEVGEKDLKLNEIKLLADVTQLEEVTVTAKVPYIERKIDRTVLNVDAQIGNAGLDALEILERAPGVSLDNDGSLMLRGRSGVSVFINDKPSYLSGSELESYLKSLPAGTIKQIEIMTNPPAKYEAAGNSGVINIITKRTKLAGFSGNMTANLRQGQYTSSNNSLNLNFNKDKLSLFSNIYGGFHNSFQDLNINRYYKNAQNERLSSFSQNSLNLRGGEYINAKIGADYYMTDRSTFGLSYKNVNNPSYRNVDNNANVRAANEDLIQRVVADNADDRTFKSEVYSGYFTHKIDTIGGSLSLDADYVSYTSGSLQKFKNFIYNSADELELEDQINGDIPSEIKIYAAKTDFSKPLNNSSKIEAGLKTALTETDNEAIYSVTIEDVTEPDYDLSNRFLYDEWINSAYLNYTKSFGVIDIQAGLRAEVTKLNGEQLGNVQKPDTSFTRTYTSLFPTFYTSWKMDTLGNNSLTFSYGRRIDRPYFQDLNPFISPLDKFTVYGGNPDLLPTYSHNFSLSHSFKGILNTSLNYSKTVDGINETLEIRERIYYSRPGNIADSESISLGINLSAPITTWYNLNAYVELGHLSYDSDLYTEQLDSKGTYYYLSATNNFQLGKGWSLDLSGQYRSDLVYAQLLIKSYGLMNLGVQKKILDDKGSLKFNFRDILYTRRGDGVINNLRLTDADWNSNYDSRTAAITFSYRFGKSLNKAKHKSTGSESEQQRVRT